MKPHIPRRSFLSAGGFSMAALAATRASSPQPQVSDSAPAAVSGERIRFGMIGVGMQGSGLLQNAISLPGLECVGAADLYDGRHTLAQQITGHPNLFTTRRYHELLERKEID